MTITEQEFEEIDARIDRRISAALDKHRGQSNTEKVQSDSRLTLVEQRLDDTRQELGLLRQDVGLLRQDFASEVTSLRTESTDLRREVTRLAVAVEQAKNAGAYLAIVVTVASLVSLFLGLR